jgi:hypothetical protein
VRLKVLTSARIVLWTFTDVSEVPAAFIIRVMIGLRDM